MLPRSCARACTAVPLQCPPFVLCAIAWRAWRCLLVSPQQPIELAGKRAQVHHVQARLTSCGNVQVQQLLTYLGPDAVTLLPDRCAHCVIVRTASRTAGVHCVHLRPWTASKLGQTASWTASRTALHSRMHPLVGPGHPSDDVQPRSLTSLHQDPAGDTCNAADWASTGVRWRIPDA